MEAEAQQLHNKEKDILPLTLAQLVGYNGKTVADWLASMTGSMSFAELAEKIRIIDETVRNLATINGQQLTNGGNIVVGKGDGAPPLFSVDFETGHLVIDTNEGKSYLFSVNADGYLCVDYY